MNGASAKPFKDQPLTFTKRLLPCTLHSLLTIALLPICLLCLYFYPLLHLSNPITNHSSLSPSPPSPPPSTSYSVNDKAYEKPCDYFNGKWVNDKRGPLYNGTTCGTIKESHNCITNGRPDSDFLYWRWKPNECNIPRFEPHTFLQLIRNKHVAFVGDSLARNQLESLLCMLSPASTLKLLHHKGARWWHFPSHNATLSSYWSPFLVQGAERLKSGPHHNTMYLDHVNEKWAKDMDKMDLIVLSVGNWFLVPSVYYEGGSVVGCLNYHGLNCTEIGFYGPLRKALRISLNSIIERKAAKGNGVDVILRTFSPSHFDGGWDKAGVCSNTEPYSKGEKQLGEMDAEIRRIEMEELEDAKVKAKQFGGFRLEALDVTQLALLRPDGHPGAYMKPFPFANGVQERVQNDCVHWCLPGPIDTWNEIFLEMVKKWKEQPRSEE
ncbi:xyloglucan O-acetyltransferase 1-like [Lotus japonicus]|uniref:xyloglucan O-acetyltransferase 1-like n=1 Tax=Lotus japonicus TaxID=34305 RepID=UPI00258B0D6A|nr:xyloglucan O-acetyltransferase 1-like [Lotus japonicus]